MKPRKTWVVVADGALARLFERGEGGNLVQIADGVMEGSRELARDVEADRQGRSYESSGAARHAIEPKTDARTKIEEAFIDRVVERLETAERGGAFERLVVVAAPHALGQIRRRLPERLAAMVVATVDKDLTKADLGHVGRAVAEVADL